MKNIVKRSNHVLAGKHSNMCTRHLT